jgi:sugar phosphate isomerase/epimerase
MLSYSVISSSSDRFLFSFVREVNSNFPDCRFEILLLRSADIQCMPSLGKNVSELTSAQILARPRVAEDIIAPWIKKVFSTAIKDIGALPRKPIAALATHFSEIATRPDVDQAAREIATDGIANSLTLGRVLYEEGLMESVIIEVVCGSIADKCECPSCNPKARKTGAAVISNHRKKIKLVLELISEATSAMQGFSGPWGIALELEPGVGYVLNDGETIDFISETIDKLNLRGRVGLNIDIAHMKIARVSAATLNKYSHLILHSHICDTPGQHTRDQPVGIWNPIERSSSQDYPFLRLLNGIDHSDPNRHGLPFSRTVSLELEGCNRIRWILESLAAMKYQLNFIQNWR